jgi:tetratricopeptide (TPR) repeat protein
MKKYCFAILMVCASFAAKAQNIPNITGSWIKTRVTFKDGKELTDDMPQKYYYLRFQFGEPDKFFISLSYSSPGNFFLYYIADNVIQTRSVQGYDVNKYRIEKITKDSLILLMDNKGFDSPQCLRYYFIPEANYQRSIPLTAKDILLVKGVDTIYRSSPKMYATYKGDMSFRQIESLSTMVLKDRSRQNDNFIATFIVNKNGGADSLKIVQGVNPEYDLKYTKMFDKIKGNWLPATYNGKAVSVQMTDMVKNIPSEKFQIFNRHTKLAETALYKGDYDGAAFNFSKALDAYQSGEVYYQLAICQLLQGKYDDACMSMLQSEELGFSAATGLKKKFCK